MLPIEPIMTARNKLRILIFVSKPFGRNSSKTKGKAGRSTNENKIANKDAIAPIRANCIKQLGMFHGDMHLDSSKPQFLENGFVENCGRDKPRRYLPEKVR